MAIDLSQLKYDAQGLIPAIVQDVQSKAVLTLAYMNQESLMKTLQTKETWFWSRTRQELWHKGATSGHAQQVHDIRYDCDQDALLVLASPTGPACHKGNYSCFEDRLEWDRATDASAGSPSSGVQPMQHASIEYDIISTLIDVIAQRDSERPEGAYTTYLFEKGIDKILKKVGEEASEVIIAAKNRDPEELRNESADLLYHLMVLWREQGLGIDQVLAILKERHSE